MGEAEEFVKIRPVAGNFGGFVAVCPYVAVVGEIEAGALVYKGTTQVEDLGLGLRVHFTGVFEGLRWPGRMFPGREGLEKKRGNKAQGLFNQIADNNRNGQDKADASGQDYGQRFGWEGLEGLHFTGFYWGLLMIDN